MASGGGLGEVLLVLSLLILSIQAVRASLSWSSTLRFQLSVVFPLSSLVKFFWVYQKAPISYSKVLLFIPVPHFSGQVPQLQLNYVSSESNTYRLYLVMHVKVTKVGQKKQNTEPYSILPSVLKEVKVFVGIYLYMQISYLEGQQ